MRLRKKYEIRDIVILFAIILLGAGLGYFFNNFSDNFRAYPVLDLETFYILILLAGFQIGACVGLIINPKTRIGGIFILSIASMALVRWHTCIFFYFTNFLIAILISVSLSMLSAVGTVEKAPSYMSMVTLTALFLMLLYYIFKLAQSELSMLLVGLAGSISVLVWIGCIHLVKGD